ncbi:MAG: hypothetical protein GXP55_06440 [Deltaproteobacteria bacterium]|nr:hypothetical protein [Deltaproteobacteria bacterium]
MRSLHIHFVTLLSLTLWCAACSQTPTRARCVQCGMPIDPTSRWTAGVTGASGEEQLFDSPKCLFRYMRGDDGRGASLPWFTEYYSQERRPGTSLRFVLGSNLSGPMGADLVPVEGEQAARRFAADHVGEQVLTYEEVDEARLRTIDAP